MSDLFVDFFKYIIIALFLFFGYNEFVMMSRDPAYEKIVQKQDKAEILSAIGSAKYAYQCGSGEPPNYYMYIDRLCVEKAVEVEVFQRCFVTLRCPGWYYVGFDKDGKTVSKYRLGE